MGVPKFFRYISERYPCLSELAREQCVPDFDNLYLDMNGIIHNCSHPDDTNIHFNITEEDMFKDIFNYIDKLFFLIKPQKLFFMAIDGVAPRAKMNQQRSRRFRSAKEAETLERLALSRGEVREHERFDSNCITPGTEFMERLHEALRYFIKSKISADPMWQKCRVILSGHNAPGEGEHKIMDYIRYLKSQNDFDPNTRHCLYGLDADLIILGLCTHELHFVVLREEVKFGRKNKKASVEETRFFLLHLRLLREYLELEFDELKQYPSFDIAKLIDDWVLMGFLVGNDFIPHLPFLNISSNALPLLYKTYKKVYPELRGNINENGSLNLERLEKYFEALSEVEFENFQENYADLKYFNTKQNGVDEAFDFDVSEINAEKVDDDLAALIESSKQFLDDEEDLSDEEGQHITDEFENFKRNYYMNKLNQENSDSAYKKEQAICYITALQWILDYYYRGVRSWGWYYPHHYAPFISDLKNFKDHVIKFDMGKPFLPFQQLLAVLPAASKALLPTAYRDLMTSPQSELIDFYPEDFETDLNGKMNEWEAVVLIPFIDEKLLLQAMEPCDQNLSPDEYKRNQHGPMLQYDYNPESQGQSPGIYSLKALYHVYCTEKPFWSRDIMVPADRTVCKELPNAARSVFFPGFPTMKHLDYKFELRCARVKVFDYPARNENMILQPMARKNLDDVFAVAEQMLNQTVYIGWPHLIKAKVVGISNKEKYIDTDGIKDMEPKIYDLHLRAVQEHLMTRMGIEFADLSVLVHVRTYVGSSYICGSQGKVSLSEMWSTTTTAYPAQGVVSQIAVQNTLTNQVKKIEQLFPENSRIFFVGNPYYGSEGVVMNPMLVYECGRLKVNITVLPEPNFAEAKYIQNQLENEYIPSHQAAVQIGIQIKCLARLTGSVLVVKGARRPKSDLPNNLAKINIGLQFKYFKSNEELVGYTRRIHNQWFMSSKAIALVQSYVEKFPLIIEYLSTSNDRSDLLFEQDIFPNDVGEGKLEAIAAWLKDQPHSKAEKIACGSKTMEKEAVEKVLEAMEELKTLPVKTVKLQVKPHLLLKPDVSLPSIYKPKRSIKLFDRVVVVKTTYMVPLGSKGTVIGVYPVSDPNPVRLECVRAVENFYEVLFDKTLPNGNDVHGIAEQRVYKVPESSVLLIFTQGNNNEQFYEAKLQLEESRNDSVKLKSQSVGNNTNTTTVVSNETKVPQIVQKGSNDFWMPSLNTKIKHSGNGGMTNRTTSSSGVANTATQEAQTNQLKILQNPLHLNQINDSVVTGTAECQEFQDGTHALKSLLGIVPSQSPLYQTQTSPNVSKAQLPKPPTSWRADAQKFPLPQTYPQLPLHQPPFSQGNAPVAVIGGNVIPLPTPTCKDQNPPQFVFNSNSLNQKGAFIPLQVARGNSQTSEAPVPGTALTINNSNIVSSVTASCATNVLTQNLSQLAVSTGGNEVNVSSGHPGATVTSVEKTAYGRKKPPRVPKIGAKFDVAY
ncbi:5'-3' exoribonuclease 1 [Stomoxys calcitrans]|uniref:5'-3' exoribonuclease 1 n=1 Tax=Stomoxys calcitrans TaxID=35570 RepID=UPI0027E23A78|nr:5'-3' exoribonuclease 1 [Stomoxys calcitrans]XP_013116162.2 5'-3' exoribonuclease 1 [Stomoxys calcitrans]